MKTAIIIVIVFLQVCVRASAQADRTVLISSKTNIKRELFKQLQRTKQVVEADEYKSMYQIDLLKKSGVPNVAIYKFGIQSAHGGCNVAFKYRNKIVFPSLSTASHLCAVLQEFIEQYPSSYTSTDQKLLSEKLAGIVKHNDDLAKSEEL